MLCEHERNYDLGMDALGTVRTAGANCLTCCMRVRSYPGKVVRQAVSQSLKGQASIICFLW